MGRLRFPRELIAPRVGGKRNVFNGATVSVAVKQCSYLIQAAEPLKVNPSSEQRAANCFLPCAVTLLSKGDSQLVPRPPFLGLPPPSVTTAHQCLSREHLEEPQEVTSIPEVAVQVSHPACHPSQVRVHPFGEGFLLHGFSLICGGNMGSFLSLKHSAPASKHQLMELRGWGGGCLRTWK